MVIRRPYAVMALSLVVVAGCGMRPGPAGTTRVTYGMSIGRGYGGSTAHAAGYSEIDNISFAIERQIVPRCALALRWGPSVGATVGTAGEGPDVWSGLHVGLRAETPLRAGVLVGGGLDLLYGNSSASVGNVRRRADAASAVEALAGVSFVAHRGWFELRGGVDAVFLVAPAAPWEDTTLGYRAGALALRFAIGAGW